MKFEFKRPDRTNSKQTRGYILTIDGEEIRDVASVVLSFPAFNLVSVEATQFVFSKTHNETIKLDRKFMLTEPINLSLEVFEIEEL